jgi:hypothetical protein
MGNFTKTPTDNNIKKNNNNKYNRTSVSTTLAILIAAMLLISSTGITKAFADHTGNTTAPTVRIDGSSSSVTRTVPATSPSGATLSWTATATDSVDSQTVNLDSKVRCNGLPATSGTTFTRAFPIGTTTVTCSVTDNNPTNPRSDTNTLTVIVQNTPPSLSVVINGQTNPSSVSVRGNIPDGKTLQWSVSASDAQEGSLTSRVTCNPPGGNPFLGNQFSHTFPIGSTPLQCSVTDSNGLTATRSITVTVTASNPDQVANDGLESPNVVDTTAEVASVEQGSTRAVGYYVVAVEASHEDNDGDERGESNYFCNVEDGTTATLTFPGLPQGVTVNPTSITLDKCGSANQKQVTFSVAANTATGEYFITPRVDDSGSDSYDTRYATFKLIVVRAADTNAEPQLPQLTDLTLEAENSQGTEVTFSVTATDAEDGSIEADCRLISGLQASGSVFPIGETTVSCTATDSGGKSDTGTFKIIVRDTTGPELTLPADITKEASAALTPVSYVASAEDAVDGPVNILCTPASDSTFALGETTVNCEAKDSRGTTTTGSFLVTIEDTTKPTLTLVNQIAEAINADGATVTYTGLSATDSVSGNLDVDCTPASGAQFALGSTPVSCSATDGAGNTATGPINVLVQDTTVPVTSIDSSTVQNNGLHNLKTATFTVGGTDAVGIASYECSIDGEAINPCENPVLVGPLGDGSHTFSVVAIDGAGNKDLTPVQIVWEVDATAPVMSGLPQSPLSVIATTSAGGKITYTLPTATDARDGIRTVTCTPASGTTVGPLGQTGTVTCTASDLAGNTVQTGNTFTYKVVWPKITFPLSPIKTVDGTTKFTLGSTVPVKFKVDSVPGFGYPTTIKAKIFYAKLTNGIPTGGTVAAGSTSAASSGNEFRYSTNGEYIFNWGTKSIATAGVYQVTVDPGDGTTKTIKVSLVTPPKK